MAVHTDRLNKLHRERFTVGIQNHLCRNTELTVLDSGGNLRVGRDINFRVAAEADFHRLLHLAGDEVNLAKLIDRVHRDFNAFLNSSAKGCFGLGASVEEELFCRHAGVKGCLHLAKREDISACAFRG